MKVPNDCIADRVWLAVPQPTEWQHIGNQIDAAMIFALIWQESCLSELLSTRSLDGDGQIQ